MRAGLKTPVLVLTSRAVHRGVWIEPGAIFMLLEFVVEGCTLPDCESVFSWMEGQRSTLATPLLWARGKLILLRTCNNLLRRLSRAAHTVLCGRVLLLLAALFPLSEKSALNMQGAYNRGNVTEWEPADAAAVGLNCAGCEDAPEEGELVVDAAFYDALWSLQHSFAHMPSVLPPAGWAKFCGSAEQVLGAFEGDVLLSDGGGGGGGGGGSGGAQPLGVAAEGTGVKYLTSSKLLRLELRDPSFRRSLLLQLLLLLRFARGPPAPHPPLKAQAPDQAASLAERARACLAAVPPGGAAFAAAVDVALERDRNWVLWKAAACKPFERPPQPETAPPDPAPPPSGPAQAQLRRRKAPPQPVYKIKLGNPELDRLWNVHADLAAAAHSSDRGPPEHLSFLEPIREQLDPAFCAEMDLEDSFKRKHDKVFCWKALRLVTRANLQAFSKASEREGGADIENVTRELFGMSRPEKLKDAPEVAPEAAPEAATEAAADAATDAAAEVVVVAEEAEAAAEAEGAEPAAYAAAAAEEAAMEAMEADLAAEETTPASHKRSADERDAA